MIAVAADAVLHMHKALSLLPDMPFVNGQLETQPTALVWYDMHTCDAA